MILCRQDLAKSVNSSVFPGHQGGPLMHVIAAKAVALKEAATPEFRAYQQQIITNAQALADGLIRRGFRLVSGGTENHLMLLDLRETELTGKVAQETLDQARITVNKNAIPFDTRSPFVTSGVRIGTPRGHESGHERSRDGPHCRPYCPRLAARWRWTRVSRHWRRGSRAMPAIPRLCPPRYAGRSLTTDH